MTGAKSHEETDLPRRMQKGRVEGKYFCQKLRQIMTRRNAERNAAKQEAAGAEPAFFGDVEFQRTCLSVKQKPSKGTKPEQKFTGKPSTPH